MRLLENMNEITYRIPHISKVIKILTILYNYYFYSNQISLTVLWVIA